MVIMARDIVRPVGTHRTTMVSRIRRIRHVLPVRESWLPGVHLPRLVFRTITIRRGENWQRLVAVFQIPTNAPKCRSKGVPAGAPARPQRPSTCGSCRSDRGKVVLVPVRLVVNDDQPLIHAVIHSESDRRGRSGHRCGRGGRQGRTALLATGATGRPGAPRRSGLTTRRRRESRST